MKDNVTITDDEQFEAEEEEIAEQEQEEEECSECEDKSEVSETELEVAGGGRISWIQGQA